MAEAARSAFDPLRRERLAALGIELLMLRDRAPASVVEAPIVSSDAPVRPRLVVAGIDVATMTGGSDAALFSSLIAALGLTRDQVSSEVQSGVPTLVFGSGGNAESIRVAPLAQLRQPHEKRAAWPVLRRLRAALRGAAARP